jgi:hypothetical protein
MTPIRQLEFYALAYLHLLARYRQLRARVMRLERDSWPVAFDGRQTKQYEAS